MAKRLQMLREAAFAAADIHRQPPRTRQQTEELITVVAPVAVVAWRARPCDPLLGVSFPPLTQIHQALPNCWLMNAAQTCARRGPRAHLSMSERMLPLAASSVSLRAELINHRPARRSWRPKAIARHGPMPMGTSTDVPRAPPAARDR